MKYLAQDLILLALNNQTGEIRSAALFALPYGLMGAVVLDLVLQGKMAIQNNHLIAVDASPTDEELLDQCLDDVRTARHSRSVRFWIAHWGRRHSGLQTVLLQNLVLFGVLRLQEQRWLWIFSEQRYFLSDPSTQQAIVNRVRAAVLENWGLDPRTAVLISLVQACRLTNALFTPQEQQQARARIRAIARGEQVGKAILGMIASTQAAVSSSSSYGAASVAGAASSSSSSHC